MHRMRHFVHVEEMRVHILQNQQAGTEEGAELHHFDYLSVTQHPRWQGRHIPLVAWFETKPGLPILVQGTFCSLVPSEYPLQMQHSTFPLKNQVDAG
eukprot:scaffold284_cov133-Skeletonema_menzelii.AAC.13